jgi:hypothetical protein
MSTCCQWLKKEYFPRFSGRQVLNYSDFYLIR